MPLSCNGSWCSGCQPGVPGTETLCPRFGKGLLTQGLIGSSPLAVPDACGLPGFLLPWQGLEGSLGVSETDRMGWGPRGCVTIRGSWWNRCDSLKGGPRREMGWAFFCPLRWAEQRLGRPPHTTQGSVDKSVPRMVSLLPFPALSPALPPGPSPLLWSSPASESGGVKGANVFSKGFLLPLHLPTLGVLGEAGGRAASWGHSSPGSRPRHPETGVPWAVVTQKVCARVCKCGCVCVRVFCLSL